MSLLTESSVADYYERNTRRFLRWGGGREVGAIHRKVWGPTVSSPTEALNYVNQLVAGALKAAQTAGDGAGHVLDLGCGVGGSAVWIAQQVGTRVTGITLSPTQAEMAGVLAVKRGVDHLCSFHVGDFLHLAEFPVVQAAYAVEAFAHAASGADFFQAVSGQLSAGGRLIICDDFLVEGDLSASEAAKRRFWTGRFKRGWRLSTLLSVPQVMELASRCGMQLIENTDLTPYLRYPSGLGLLALKGISRLPLSGAYWQSVQGGIALWACQVAGWTDYRFTVWEKDTYQPA